jgi:hypothetical protein
MESEGAPAEKTEDMEAEPTEGPANFNELWPTLLASGWTYKSGNGLISWYYLKPGVKGIKGAKEGQDYWTSATEDALWSHVTGKPMPAEEIVEETGRRARTSRKTDRYVDEVSLTGQDESKTKRKRAVDGDYKSDKKQRPTVPKRAASAYTCFARTMRPKLASAAEDADDIPMQLSTLWKEANAEEKQPFVDEAQADKERYTSEMEEFMEENPDHPLSLEFEQKLGREQQKEREREEKERKREALQQEKEVLKLEKERLKLEREQQKLEREQQKREQEELAKRAKRAKLGADISMWTKAGTTIADSPMKLSSDSANR